MKTIGVKELREHLSKVLREIEETGQTISVSNRGRIVARLVPTYSAQLRQRTKRDPRVTIAEIDALAREISADLSGEVNVADIISDMRR
ncbi:MAG TPA: type II toxin-antitoxin system prevent-host-death family antitoxin [Chloroflexia bacterium]|nr:type II toxin-antitoxin system prevent-host-death family antitoxin [Chloroflexia bacterium]